MAHRLKISARAIREIGEAYEWYESQRAGLGAGLIAALDAQLEMLKQEPLASQEVRPRIRRALLAHFPYGVFYACRGDLVAVLAVVHTARNPLRWPRAR